MATNKSKLNDREFRHALEQQRQIVDALEEEERNRERALKETREELKVENAKLGRLIRGEPEPGELDGPGLPFEGVDNKSLGAGERPEPEDTPRGRRGRGPRSTKDSGEATS